MESTRLSTKGEIALPRRILQSRDWQPGTEFTVEDTADGILLRPVVRLPESDLDEVVGCLRSTGRRRTDREMRSAVDREVKRRHDSGRY